MKEKIEEVDAEEIKDLIQADIAYENNRDIIRFKTIEELDKFFEVQEKKINMKEKKYNSIKK